MYNSWNRTPTEYPIALIPRALFSLEHKHKHKHRHKAVDQSLVTLTQTSCEHMKSSIADASSAILFIIGLRRADIENWVKYAILCVRKYYKSSRAIIGCHCKIMTSNTQVIGVEKRFIKMSDTRHENLIYFYYYVLTYFIRASTIFGSICL